jgi:flagellar hook-associated protein 1 FlgK
MSLFAALSIATGGLANINNRLAVVSQNVANASTPDYSREVATQSDFSAGGLALGVVSGPTGRQLDTALQESLYQQNGVVAGLQTTQTALQALDAVQGTPGQGADLTSLLGVLQNAFSTLENNPSNQTQQQQVVTSARNLTGQINALGNAVVAGRQTAQDAVVRSVGSLNSDVATLGGLSYQIIKLKAAGQSTADLENQRDAAMNSLSGVISVRFLAQPDGDLQAITAGGLDLPIHSITPPFATLAATIGAGTCYPGGGVPAITLNGVDVTQQLTGGQLGANITLRDQTLPGYQGQLDEFSQTLSTRFDQQGLTLFTDPTGAVPIPAGPPTQTGYIGYANIIQVNPAVTANATLVRDGSHAVVGGAGGPSPFVPNPVGGPSGFTTLIARILNYAMGTQAQAGVAQPPPATAGLGPSGTLAAPYAAPSDLAGFATAMVGVQAADSGAATSQVTNEQAVQSSLGGKLNSEDGVSIDQEMSNMVALQNSYGANAKVMTVVQALWTDLFQMVT